MREKSTSDLRQELMSAPSIDAYVRGNQASFSGRTALQLLMGYFARQPRLTKAELAKKSGMSEVYLYQVFSGRRRPSRDRLICLCVGLSLTLDETQGLLKRAAFSPLYPRYKRDAIIIFGLVHGQGLYAINDQLFLENEKTLF